MKKLDQMIEAKVKYFRKSLNGRMVLERPETIEQAMEELVMEVWKELRVEKRKDLNDEMDNCLYCYHPWNGCVIAQEEKFEELIGEK